ncbi:hypothetical protein FPZ42_17410 [Mucilaginibacter achroorhodeus]|uniref:Uncharacterized protein n=1 Tax=Mucilaginibacter achroorhodeus TaxID=2599294 RepID=A0A563U073_9SPHI|nr:MULTISPECIES: hypothetical protein [Mucilaginibacter]QXV66047.1 hypothetical protein INP83_02825 [Mucilaginibacter sp. 21P]TWR24261.1 hypothetical protein FPZ42_17410 [Mucilaginibacter achroorhodeus]
MKKRILYFCIAGMVSLAACKGNGSKSASDTSAADSGQEHVGNQSPTDTGKLPATPVETGGKDSTGNGAGTTNMPKDTVKTH